MADLRQADTPTRRADARSTTCIGVVGLRGIPDVMGGVESHVEQLYPRLKRLRPGDAIIVTQRASYVDPTRRDYQGLALATLPAVRNKYLEAISHTLIAILFLRFRRRCGIVHLHAIGPGLLSPLARLLGLRVLLTHHGADYDRAKWNRFAKATLRAAEWLALTCAHETIVVSEGLADALRRRFPARAGRIHAIPNGAGLVFSRAARDWSTPLLDGLGLRPKTFILAVGRLVPEKGFDDLIAAHRASGDPRTLVIAGKADHQDAYARTLLDQADDRIVFAGFQPHEALRSLYAAASLFVLPSYHEGLPIAALEAAAMGTPMLLSDIAPNVEIGLPAICYYPTGSVAALAEKLALPADRFAIDSDAIGARFDWDAIALSTSTVIDRLVR